MKACCRCFESVKSSINKKDSSRVSTKFRSSRDVNFLTFLTVEKSCGDISSHDIQVIHVGQNEDGKEVFAKWIPHFDSISSKFLTDANGFDLITRKVNHDENSYFSA